MGENELSVSEKLAKSRKLDLQLENDWNTGSVKPFEPPADTWKQTPSKSTGLFIMNYVLKDENPELARIDIPATPTEISDDLSVNVDTETPRGRSVGYVGYNNTSNRTVSFSLRIIGELINSVTGDDSNGLVSLINRIKALEYPNYPSAGTIVPPNCYVNMYDGIRFSAICTSVSVVWGGPLVGSRRRPNEKSELGTAYAYADVSLAFTNVVDAPYQAIDIASTGNNNKLRSQRVMDGDERNAAASTGVSQGKYDDMTFNQAFAAARKEQGPGGTFTWRGNEYNTNYATPSSGIGTPNGSGLGKNQPGVPIDYD